ncbi:uncharacterized protein LOC119432880 isoform X2 [Dermacentor silvarum]|uniref:uncharacterized protein LOC119432880 isoform X2 n=1 Tax=Dermacentor silvarum TaxID=543639 RepID=UPI0021013A20|nr:uncharacterized protein LOC119432880 isoform X2 [Dermacentor silvarum]
MFSLYLRFVGAACPGMALQSQPDVQDVRGFPDYPGVHDVGSSSFVSMPFPALRAHSVKDRIGACVVPRIRFILPSAMDFDVMETCTDGDRHAGVASFFYRGRFAVTGKRAGRNSSRIPCQRHQISFSRAQPGGVRGAAFSSRRPCESRCHQTSSKPAGGVRGAAFSSRRPCESRCHQTSSKPAGRLSLALCCHRRRYSTTQADTPAKQLHHCRIV